MGKLKSINVDSENTAFKSIDGVLFNYEGDILYAYPVAKPGNEYTVPDAVTTIKAFAFAGDYQAVDGGLRTVYIPANVTSIGEAAFAGSGVFIFVEHQRKPEGWHYYWSEGAEAITWDYESD